jgi:hypothetical protein
MRRGILVSLGLALGLAAALAPGRLKAADGVAGLSYAGYIGAARVLEFHLHLDFDPARGGRYRVSIEAATLGTLAKLLPLQLSADADGRTTSSGVTPVRYHSLASLLQRRQVVTIAYSPNGRVTVRSDPPSAESEQAAKSRLGDKTLDPVSALLALIVGSDDGCGGAVPVFDGFRRYDLRLLAAGEDVLERSQDTAFEGMAEACLIEVDLGQDAAASASPVAKLVPTTGRVWFAPVLAGFPAVPVRLTGDSGLGPLRLDLVAVEPAGAPAP